MWRILAISALLTAGASMTAHADVYRWVDADGRVHYTDRWVPGAERIKLLTGHTGSQPVAPNAQSDSSQLAATNERIKEQLAAEADARAVKQDVDKVRGEQCKEAQAKYKRAIEARRIYRVGKDGQREYLSDVEADTERMNARTEMREACGTTAG